jgi:hypothetical protein
VVAAPESCRRPGVRAREVRSGREGLVAGRAGAPGLARRRLLAAALAGLPALAAGCGKGFGALGTPPRPGPGVRVLTRAIRAEQLMIARYEAALSRSPALAATLGPLLAEHRAHLTALSARLVPGAAPTPAAAPAPSPAAPPAPLPWLAAAEDAAAAGYLRQLAPVPPSLAQLLASIAASEATHAAVLGGQSAAGAGPGTAASAALQHAYGLAAGGARAAGGHPGGPAVTALEAALAAEHAAIYGYAVAGAHLTGRLQAAAQRDWTEHQQARDALIALLARRGAAPVAAATSYRLPFPVASAAAAVSLAALLEDRVTTAYLGLVGLADQALRAFGAQAVQAAALRAVAWQHRTTAFPGLTAGEPRPAR